MRKAAIVTELRQIRNHECHVLQTKVPLVLLGSASIVSSEKVFEQQMPPSRQFHHFRAHHEIEISTKRTHAVEFLHSRQEHSSDWSPQFPDVVLRCVKHCSVPVFLLRCVASMFFILSIFS